ncbi:MAG TPA: ACP S-malonyltransferase, partial [Solirubrobacteraceae bacterium]
MRTALLFPGQGSHVPGMDAGVAAARPDLLALAAEAVGEDPFARAAEGTRFAQPAILCASLAALAVHDGPAPAAVAGHSLGELTALVAAQAIEERDAVALVALRGRLMQAAADSAPAPGGMLAVLGPLDAAALAARHGVAVANDNAPGQVVLSGGQAALRRAAAEARAAGARAIALGVAGAFHSPHMAPAVPAWTEAVARAAVRAPRLPVYSCVTAAPVAAVPDVR